MSWRPEFFVWLWFQLIVVEDWPYAGTEFMGDPDLPLPEGEDWDEELGVTLFYFYFFMIFFGYMPIITTFLCVCRCWPREARRHVAHCTEDPSRT